MNSTEELSTYRTRGSGDFYSPTKKTAYFEYDFSDEKPTKKDKKWSFGNLFRRKKKTTGSSSDEESKKNSDKKRNKQDKRKKTIAFDHVIVTQPQVKCPETFDAGQRSIVHTPRGHPQFLSLDGAARKSRRELTKVRAEARRTSYNQYSSSDDDSLRSTNSSRQFRSDESLTKSRDARRSRSARTERYLKRHSRDGENPNCYLKISASKSDAESSSLLKLSEESGRSPSGSPSQFHQLSHTSISSQSPSLIGRVSTIPPTHINHTKFRATNSTSSPSYKPPLSMNEYYNHTKILPTANAICGNQRSVSFDANIHRPQEHYRNHPQPPQVIHAKLELGRPRSRHFTIVDVPQSRFTLNVQNPPPPPPRDPRRLQSIHGLDNINHTPILSPPFKSSSEDHLPRDELRSPFQQRPSSTLPEGITTNTKWTPTRPDNYQYLTDKQPRSRRPIVIQNGITKSSSQKEVRQEKQTNSAFLEQLRAKKSNRNRPQIITPETKPQAQLFLPSVLSNNNNDELEKTSTNDQTEQAEDEKNRNSDTTELRRKSANLEEALNELEAIYNSLKLGDEDLLEMAEKREKEMMAAQRIANGIVDYPSWKVGGRGTMSDSGFSYEPFDSLDAKRRRRYGRESRLRNDDMAFRKINKTDRRAATINDPRDVAAKISYMMTSPVYSGIETPKSDDGNTGEPDVTRDDVLYRSIKQSSKLKVPEHPPPFGIPLGPITLSANSDYLHAAPGEDPAKRGHTPDLVADDLAFRNLRKDHTKEPALPPVSAEDLKNNNLNVWVREPLYRERVDLTADSRKKRAIRSKSANIGSLVSQEVIDRASRRNARDASYKTLTDIADAMQIARQVLRDKENKINETKRASMSDTDAIDASSRRYHSSMMYRSPKHADDQDSRKVPKKEDTPDPVSHFEDCRSSQGPLLRTDSFEQVLAALAIETKEVSDKFTENLNDMQAHKIATEPIPVAVQKSEDLTSEPETMESVATIVFSRSENEAPRRKSPYEELEEHLLNAFEELNETTSAKEGENSPGESCVDVVRSVAFDSIGECVPGTRFPDSDGGSSGYHSYGLRSTKLGATESLKSPKLVLETSKLTGYRSDDSGNGSRVSNGSTRNFFDLGHIPDSFKASGAWHNDPATLAIACSYGIACFHQLATSDLFAVMSIVLAVLTFIAAMFM